MIHVVIYSKKTRKKFREGVIYTCSRRWMNPLLVLGGSEVDTPMI